MKSSVLTNNFKSLNFINKRVSLAIGLTLALATFLRLFRLGYQSLWIDEINAVNLANKNIFEILYYGGTASPFIYLVNHFWQKLGSSDFMVRFPSVIFGVLSIYATYKLAKIFFGIREALLSSFLMSISLYHLMYSQEAARPYSAFILFSILSFYCLCKFLTSDNKRYRRAFIIFTVLNFYTHFFAVFSIISEVVIMAIFIFTDFHKKKDARLFKKRLLQAISAMLWILIFCLPQYRFFWEAAGYELTPIKVVLSFKYYKNFLCRYGAGNGLALVFYNLFFIAGLIAGFKTDKRREAFVLLLWIILPFSILSFLTLKHFFHIRYLIFTYPAYIIIVSKGVTTLLDSRYIIPRKNAIAAAIIVIFASLSYLPLKLYYQMPARLGDWKGAIEYVYSKADAGAFIITNPFHDTLLQYYLNKKPIPGKIHIVTHYNDERFFKDMLLHSAGRQLYYITSGNDEIKSVAEAYFENNKVFFPPVYERLGKRELIDWDDTSWFSISENRYRLVVYFNNQN